MTCPYSHIIDTLEGKRRSLYAHLLAHGRPDLNCDLGFKLTLYARLAQAADGFWVSKEKTT